MYTSLKVFAKIKRQYLYIIKENQAKYVPNVIIFKQQDKFQQINIIAHIFF